MVIRFYSNLLPLICSRESGLMTRVLPQGCNPGAFLFQSTQSVKFPAVSTQSWRSAVETATAVEITQGGLRQLLIHEFHQLFGKASAKNGSGFPTVPTAPALTPITTKENQAHFVSGRRR